MQNDIVKNPLNNNFIDIILDIFIRYKSISKMISNMSLKSATSESIIYKDVFYKTIFENWKEYILNYDSSQLPEINQEEIKALKKYLKNINVKNGKDALNYSDPTKIEDKIVSTALKKYSWIHNNCNNYYRISSQPIDNNLKKNCYAHNLYLNCDTNKLHQILLLLIKKCKELNINYFIEYNEQEHRDDILIIKTDEKNLEKFINIINEIIKENNLENNIHEVPILTGKINSQIGYSISNDSNETFLNKRINHLVECIKNETIAYIIKESHEEITLPSGRKILYKDFLIKNLAIIKRNNLLNKITDKQSNRINNREFLKELESEIRKKYNLIIDSLYSNDKNLRIDILCDRLKIDINYDDLEELIRSQTFYFNNKIKSYKSDLLNRIKETSKNHRISPNNYAYDIIESATKKQDAQTTKIRNVSPTSNLEEDSNYKTSKTNTKPGVIFEKNYETRSIKMIIEDLKNNIAKI